MIFLGHKEKRKKRNKLREREKTRISILKKKKIIGERKKYGHNYLRDTLNFT